METPHDAKEIFRKCGTCSQTFAQSLIRPNGFHTRKSTEVLKLDPLNKLGTPLELIRAFRSKEAYRAALKELEAELYKTGA